MAKVKRGRKSVERDPRWIALGQKLVELREAKRWKAYEVANMIGVDPATISHIENGKRATGPERETLEHLAKLYQVPLNSLVGSDPLYGPKTSNAPDGAPVAGSAIELDQIRAAVQDAIFAVFADIFEILAHARAARATQESEREARSPDRRASG
jgi:transcriptional regulator with XRE-family HTH domain